MPVGVKIVLFIVLAAGLLWYGRDYNARLDEEAARETVEKQSEAVAEQKKVMDTFKKEDLKVGTGAEAKTGNTISVHYTGTLDDGTKFDSSFDRNQPFEFKLGAGSVIQGWDLGFEGMKVGGKRRLTIPPELGYGTRGFPPRIPPNATLHFDVELLSVK